jgi:hypothetical protein
MMDQWESYGNIRGRKRVRGEFGGGLMILLNVKI